MEQQNYTPPLFEHFKFRRQDFYPLIMPILKTYLGEEKTEWLMVKTNSHWRRP